MTNIIAASSGELTADEVAKKTLNGIKSGRFTIPCSLNGLLMAKCTAGLSPQRSFLTAFVEVVAAGIARMIAFLSTLDLVQNDRKDGTAKQKGAK